MGLASCGVPSGGPDEASDGSESGGTEGTDPAEAELGSAKSELPRDDSPHPSPGELEQMRLGEWAFAHELYAELTASDDVEPGDNMMISPYSLRAAFGMSWAGAVGETETEMAEVLRFDSQATTHEVLNYIDLALAARNDLGDEDNPPVSLLTNNRFFLHFDFPVLDSYLDVLAVNYGADVKLVDFRDGESSRLQINEWVAYKTQDRITDLLPQGSIKDLTGLGGTVSVLVNTLYLKAPWAEAFPKWATQPADFTLRDGSIVQTDMMHHKVVGASHAVLDGYTIVDLPLRRGELSVLMILPPAADDPALDAWFDPQWLDIAIASLAATNIELRMPRFTLAGDTIALRKTFESLGMEAPFEGGFDNAYPSGVYIDNIYQQVFFAVDEAGVEGAAATAIVNGIGFTPDEPPPAEFSVTLDRPFLTLVRDRATGTILFMGRVTQPQ